ncbi:alpha/beta fold hydrolase [Croceicoccus hydrothermalis]|uniref:alpha/beta fold hydrolase n=1 Tax=Croceicoccus hydrothermalis TaxID=2867964 RepID=UPI001EFBFC9C|nr:alpha/beta hydrolase [Croceicoccus hydrothermalis]
MAQGNTITRPSYGWTALEPARSLLNVAALMASWPMLGAAPRGDGHPVMVLPGFATNDAMTALLRMFLKRIGYDVHTWDLGWNFDHRSTGENGEHIAARIAAIARRTGRSVSLVGWSLGGVIAREAARRDPADVRQVIALGSPFTGNPDATNLGELYELLTGNRVSDMERHPRYVMGGRPLSVPSTAIYSKSDGITAWENCVSETDAQTENIEVWSSHFGFMANPAVLYAVADRLACAEDGWTRFVPGGPFRAFYFPTT